MSDERPMCWQCAEGAMKDGAEIERLREDNAILLRLVGAEKRYRAELEATTKHQAARIHSQRDEINRLLAAKADEVLK